MMNRIVSDEIYRLIEDETSSFKNFSTTHIIENYKLGVSDLIVRFKSGELQILKNRQLIEEKKIVNVRSRLLAAYVDDAKKKYPEIVNNWDFTIPVCFSDTSDDPLQEIPCLVFSKTAFSTNILMPSPNNLIGHWEVDRVKAFDGPLHTKTNKLCFIGSLTGNTSAELMPINMRANVAGKLAGIDNAWCRILRPPQTPDEYWNEVLTNLKTVHPDIPEDFIMNQHSKIEIEEQIRHKYQVCVDGHSCAWARLPWQMSSNCVPLKVRNPRHNWKEWFYPLLNPNKHFLEVDIEELIPAYNYLETNPQAQLDIAEAGKSFVDKYCSPELALDVLVQTLDLLNTKQDNSLISKSELEASGQAEIRRV